MKKIDEGNLKKLIRQSNEICKRAFRNFKSEIKKVFESKIVDLELLYVREKNPLFAFEALIICRKNKIEIPAWVLDYFTDSAEILCNFKESNTSGERASEFVMDALNLKRNKGSRSIFFDYWAEMENLSIYYKIKETRELMQSGKLSRKRGQDIYDIVGEMLNMSPSKVKTVYYKEKRQRKQEKKSPHGKPHLY